MASMERMSPFRHEGHVFFIYDHTIKTEEDDPKDAILYFYPSSVRTDDQVALVGGIIGLANFCLEFLPQSIPKMVKLSFRNFALLQHEDFIIGLGGSPDIPDTFLIAHMQFVWSTFVLYQGSLSALKKRVSPDNFVKELKTVWDYYLPMRQIQEDSLSQAFHMLPYVQLHKSQGNLFLHASHIIQHSLSYKGVMTGAIFNKKKVLCTQLSNSLTRQLLLLMSHSQFPCVEVNSVLELPEGVRLLHVYLPKKECAALGCRRKKAYKRPVVERQNQASADQSSRQTHVSQGTPDYISAENSFHIGTVSSGSEKLNKDSDDVSPENRSSGGRETSTSTVSPAGALTPGTDSEVFLDTLSDMIFDNQNELKLTDIKHLECATSSTKLSPSYELNNGDPASNKSPNDSAAHLNGALASQENTFRLENSESFSGLSLQASSESKNLSGRIQTSDEIPHKSSNNVSEHINSLISNNNSEVNNAEMVSNFNENKADNINKESLSSDQVCVESLSNSAQNSATDGQNLEKQDTEINGNHFLTASTLENHSGAFSHSYSDSVDSIMTSTESSHFENTLSSDQQQNNEYPQLKPYLKIGGGITANEESELHENTINQDSSSKLNLDAKYSIYVCQDSGLEPDSEFKNIDADHQESSSQPDADAKQNIYVCQDSVLEPDYSEATNTSSDNQNSSLKPDFEIKNSTPVCQDSMLKPEAEIKTIGSSYQESKLEPDSEIKNGVPVCKAKGLESNSEIKTNISADTNISCDLKSALEPGIETNNSMHDHCDTLLKQGLDTENSISSNQKGELEPDSEIKNSIPANKGLGYEGNIHVASKGRPNQLFNQITHLKNPDIVENQHSGISNTSSSDLTNESSGIQGTKSPSNLSQADLFNVAEMLEQNKEQIDSSLEVRASGDESSTQSSSELKKFGHKTSDLSLTSCETGTNRDRLTFDSLDSEYSEGGLLSPVHFQLSAVAESLENLMAETSPSKSESDESTGNAQNNNRSAKTALGRSSRSASAKRDVRISVSDWHPQKDDLEEVTLYAQGHSDTLLLLLLSHSVKCSKVYISSLWKSCLSHLAELDFHVKDAERHVKDDTENVGANYQYIKYDSFTNNLKGSALLPVTSLANEIVDSSIRMHESFLTMPDLKEITYRSHSACCYGQRSVNTETYFQLGLSRTSAGISLPNDKTFFLDQLAEKFVQNDK